MAQQLRKPSEDNSVSDRSGCDLTDMFAGLTCTFIPFALATHDMVRHFGFAVLCFCDLFICKGRYPTYLLFGRHSDGGLMNAATAAA
jgi:hypothetical protein